MTVRREIDLTDPDWWHKEALRLYEENDQLRREIEKSKRQAEQQRQESQREAAQVIGAMHEHYNKLSRTERLEEIEGQNRTLSLEINKVQHLNRQLQEKVDELGQANRELLKAYGLHGGSPKPSPLRMRSFGLLTFWKESKRSND